MGTYSVALFGHFKPRFYLQDKTTGITVKAFFNEPTDFDIYKFRVHSVDGWEKRCVPGDIIDFKPLDEADKWTRKERSAFLIVTIDGVTREQLEGGLIEPEWDLESYPEYAPFTPADFNQQMLAREDELKQRKSSIKNMWSTLTVSQKDKEYRRYLELEQTRCQYPSEYNKKKRMQISLNMLRDAKVDLEQMLNPTLLYNPKIDYFTKTDCFDKLNSKNVSHYSSLNTIPKKELT